MAKCSKPTVKVIDGSTTGIVASTEQGRSNWGNYFFGDTPASVNRSGERLRPEWRAWTVPCDAVKQFKPDQPRMPRQIGDPALSFSMSNLNAIEQNFPHVLGGDLGKMQECSPWS